ncbi:hypothetical protein HMPREF0379_0419 [[Eubacterium] yurii subsp. margaretiae ATCC 43715]|nr:hypothetical protein HMPREF0379_0419 [[Eubacterium] yurii subsp. margaretiae ATCC 43715]
MWKKKMNKIKSNKHTVINTLLIFICLILAFFTFSVYSFKMYSDAAEKMEEYVKDNKYKIVIEEICGEATVPFQVLRPRVVVGKKVDDKWIYKKSFEIPIAVVGGLEKKNCSINWIDGGVIIKVTGVEKEKDMTYRVYWEDVF